MRKIRRDDQILVIAGRDRGKQGRVRQVLIRERRLLVEGVQMVKRHLKSQPGVRQAGIIEKEAPISTSSVMLLCPKCEKPVRVGFKIKENKQKARVCKKCQQEIE